MKVCEVEGCSGAVVARRMCNMHYLRNKRHGAPGGAETLRPGIPTYGAVHERLRVTRGSAKAFQCVAEGCEKGAQEWAYDHKDKAHYVTAHGSPFSNDLSHYMPMCCACHRRLDQGALYEQAVQ